MLVSHSITAMQLLLDICSLDFSFNTVKSVVLRITILQLQTWSLAHFKYSILATDFAAHLKCF